MKFEDESVEAEVSEERDVSDSSEVTEDVAIEESEVDGEIEDETDMEAEGDNEPEIKADSEKEPETEADGEKGPEAKADTESESNTPSKKAKKSIPGLRFLKRRWKRLLFLAILAYGIYVGLQVKAIMDKAEEKTAVISTQTFESVSQMDISNSIAVTGTIISNESRNVATLVSKKKVTKVYVEVGDYVNKGDPICTFDTTATEEKIEKINRQMVINNAKAELNLYKAKLQLAWAMEDAVRALEEQQLDTNSAIRGYNEQEYTVGYREEDLEDALKELEDAEDDYDDAKRDLRNASPTDSDYESLRSAKKSAKQAVENAEDAVESARRNLKSAQFALQDKVDSYNKTINSQETSNIKNSRTISENQNSLAEVELNNRNLNEDEREELDELNDELNDCRVSAPMAGLITSVSVTEGDEYEEKSSICVIQDDTCYKVSGTVDQYDISSVHEGMEVVIKTEATGDDEMKGTVTFVSPVPQNSSGSSGSSGQSTAGSSTASSSTDYPIEITIEGRDERLRIGMTAETSVLVESRKGVMAVPYDAIETDESGASYVNVAVTNNNGPYSKDFNKGGRPERGTPKGDAAISYLTAGEGKIGRTSLSSDAALDGGWDSEGNERSLPPNRDGGFPPSPPSDETAGFEGESGFPPSGDSSESGFAAPSASDGGYGGEAGEYPPASDAGVETGEYPSTPNAGEDEGNGFPPAGEGVRATPTSEKPLWGIILDVILCRVTEDEETASNEIQTKKVPVTTGLETDYYIEVTSGDISVGDEVLIPDSISSGLSNYGGMGGFMGGPGGGPRGGGRPPGGF